MKTNIWNPWHGCHKISEGCRNCYVYRRDESVGKVSTFVTRNKSFHAPLERDRYGQFKMQGTIFACMTSDFFLDKADAWRDECWQMMRRRRDAEFFIITKRIDRFMDCIPDDWGVGYENVSVCCTVENQKMADFRLPIFLEAPIHAKYICCEPLLGPIDLSPYLSGGIRSLVVGGESGPGARICEYDWVLALRGQCDRAGVPFHFKQTGRCFKKDGKLYIIPRKFQSSQARRAGIDISPEQWGR